VGEPIYCDNHHAHKAQPRCRARCGLPLLLLARVKGASRGVEEEFIRCRASEFWGFSYRERRYTEFIDSGYAKPSGYVTVSLRSRDLFRYGVFKLRARLARAEGALYSGSTSSLRISSQGARSTTGLTLLGGL